MLNYGHFSFSGPALKFRRFRASKSPNQNVGSPVGNVSLALPGGWVGLA